MIPPIVHQIWVGLNPPTEEQRAVISRTQAQLGDEGIEHHLWTNDNYPLELPPNIRLYAASCRAGTSPQVNYGAFEADALRYWLIYKFGGVYIDCDCLLLRPAGELLQILDGRPAFARLWPKRKAWPTNAFLAAQPSTPFFEHVVSKIKPRSSNNPGYIGPAWLGARLSSFFRRELCESDNQTLSQDGNIQMLDESDFLFKSPRNQNAYLEHRFWYSWRRKT